MTSPINWHGVLPEEAGKDTPRRDRKTYQKAWYRAHYQPKPPKRFRINMRSNRENVTISITKDLNYDEWLDIWEKVQDVIIERQEEAKS